MRVIKIFPNEDNDQAALEAVSVLKRGGVIVYPTDTVYGLGANACDYNCADLVFKIKNRPYRKALPIIARNMKWVNELAFVPPKLENILSQIWPGQITVVLPKRNIIPRITTGGLDNVGIRVPDYEFIDKVLARFGYPITATSANLSGESAGWRTSGDIAEIIKSFSGRLWKPDLIIDAGILPKSLPSTVVDFSTIKPRILRSGCVKPNQLMKLLEI